MVRRAQLLTDKQVRALNTPGLHAVGGPVPGLALQVTAGSGHGPTRSWVLRVTVGGRRRSMGLGSYPLISLATARAKAEGIHRSMHSAGSPVPEPPKAAGAAKARKIMTFKEAATTFIEERRLSWKNVKHAAQWESTLATYAHPVIGHRPVDEVDKAMVLAVVKPIWGTKTETANRVRDRIKMVLSWAKAHGLREGDNPAEWRGNLEHALPGRTKVSRPKHHPALPVDDAPGFLLRLRREQKDLAARALEFAIFTAARDGEVRGATWPEVDLDAGIWTIPAERMKAGKVHRVPLSTHAAQLLKAMPRVADNNLVFPGQSKTGRLSENTLNEVIKRMHAVQTVQSDVQGRPAVVHGMRSTFRNWGREKTNFRPELLELSLAHTVGNAAERAYARDDALEQRRALMEAWAVFLSLGAVPKN